MELPDLSDGVVEVQDEEQWESLLASTTERPLVVQFTAPWCKPCKKIAPVFDSLADGPCMTFARLDIDELAEAAAAAGVSAIPAFHVYRDTIKVRHRYMSICFVYLRVMVLVVLTHVEGERPCWPRRAVAHSVYYLSLILVILARNSRSSHRICTIYLQSTNGVVPQCHLQCLQSPCTLKGGSRPHQ